MYNKALAQANVDIWKLMMECLFWLYEMDDIKTFVMQLRTTAWILIKYEYIHGRKKDMTKTGHQKMK
jgi:hypothetical protein